LAYLVEFGFRYVKMRILRTTWTLVGYLRLFWDTWTHFGHLDTLWLLCGRIIAFRSFLTLYFGRAHHRTHPLCMYHVYTPSVGRVVFLLG